jgi:hypothetical protein
VFAICSADISSREEERYTFSFMRLVLLRLIHHLASLTFQSVHELRARRERHVCTLF